MEAQAGERAHFMRRSGWPECMGDLRGDVSHICPRAPKRRVRDVFCSATVAGLRSSPPTVCPMSPCCPP